MRVGTWVPVYNSMVPIPERLAVSFGLDEGSQLHLATFSGNLAPKRHDVELIVSPVPVPLWRKVCRLSVRLEDKPHALELATRFVADKKINILLTESCATYRERAHWDAICDISLCEGAPRETSYPETFAREMTEFLAQLSSDFEDFATDKANRKAFIQKPHMDIRFTSLPGLNDSSFVPSGSEVLTQTLHHRTGGVELTPPLVRHISKQCGDDSSGERLPPYAMITGNTEQRYMRIFFTRRHKSMFRAVVRNDLQGLPGGGIGALNAFLASLPEEVDLIKTSNYITESAPGKEKGSIEIFGYWEGKDSDEAALERRFEEIINGIELKNQEGSVLEGAFSVEAFGRPDPVYPRVFVSYSTQQAERELKFVREQLWDSHFQPIVGTEFSRYPLGPTLADQPEIPSDVSSEAFGILDGCVAAFSIVTPRQDLLLKSDSPQEIYAPAPWIVAEESYAWARGLKVVRVRHENVGDPKYNRNIREFLYRDQDGFDKAVKAAISELIKFRRSDNFSEIEKKRREHHFRPKYLP
jgi:hypothetical protein